jgi:hypothetical protein
LELEVRMDLCYAPSSDVVAREIEGELIIVPLTSRVVESGDEMFSANESGRAIWARLDGKTDLNQIAASLAEEFDAPVDEIVKDIRGFLSELLKRNMVEASGG